MVKVYLKPTVKWYESQVGYSSGSTKSSKYSKTLDAVNFYNTKKNGYTNWCAITYDCGIYENADNKDDINGIRAILCEPNKDNCGAGCKQKIDYYKAAGRWYPHKVKGCPAEIGDEIFFAASSYVTKENPYGVYHTGAVVDWTSKGLYTVEGNTDGGKVSRRFYAYNDSRIYGFGRPKWSGVEPPKETSQTEPTTPAKPTEPVETPKPTPTLKSIDEIAKEVINGKWGNGKDRADKLTKAGYNYDKVQKRVNELLKTPTYKTYTVSAIHGLNVRKGPGTNYGKVDCLSNGIKVKVYETKNGWGKIGTDRWVSMTYLK